METNYQIFSQKSFDMKFDYSLFKRIFDLISSIIALLILLPLFILISLSIKASSPGSIFFVQTRVGRHANKFKMVKFRTMKINHGGSSVSVLGESRITPLGAILRKYKLDELPELWNILIGDMSIVGPRPDVPGYADLLKGTDRILLSVRPGLTGPASIKYSNEEELLALQPDPKQYNDEILYPDKVRINLEYIRNMSFGTDIKMIVFTLLGKTE